jgi:hypothetical protein
VVRRRAARNRRFESGGAGWGRLLRPKPLEAIASIPDTSAPVYGKTAADTSDDWWVSTWSYPVVRNGYIYVTDIRNGLYILKATPSSSLATALAASRSWRGPPTWAIF